MITCIINGHKAYPISTSSIKVTYANQYVTDDGEYTYDITFPMNILENRVIFKNVSRLEVKKNVAKYDDCKLFCNSQLIMSGIGTILSVNEKEIKLQIVGGKSRIKFNDRMTKHYIDEIPFGTADKPGYDVDKGWSQMFKEKLKEIYRLDEDKSLFLGVEGKWCFVPVRDETNDIISNFVGVDKTKQFIGYNAPYIANPAVQPNLMYIFRKVVEYEGYTLKRNDFDCKPWNLLYIASAYKTRELCKALPHWSSYTFIEEFRKLFNATIVFDDILKTCSVINASELTTADSIEVEPMDEYTTDYDEDGSFSTSSTANLEYNLGNSANRDNYEVITKKVFDNFEIVHSKELMGANKQFASTTLSWSEKQKRQTIIENFGNFYVYMVDENDNKSWKPAGIWSPLIRDSSSDDFVDLNISPAAQVVENINFKSGLMEDKYYERRCLLSMPNDKESDSKECDVDDDGYSYTSVQDALDDESALDNSEDEQECMNIFFILPGRVQSTDGSTTKLSWVGEKSRWPQFLTDYRINEGFRLGIAHFEDSYFSLSLCMKSEFGTTSLGTLHANGLKIDNKNCMEVKFKSDDIPDPSKIYIIRNKRFVCEKIEMEVKDDAIEPVYTGYFYMLS
ncbi:hypothetical protein RJT11_01515 [Segatella copri]|uniref:hypothetical protein n=1 Tax=Segatella copri TaxID=165179 RepID=UPI00294AF49F|nr:hypothetical protein [Segatella copri]WOG04238.1 hypothetical protein RJT11_01515 [Segatella copri]